MHSNHLLAFHLSHPHSWAQSMLIMEKGVKGIFYLPKIPEAPICEVVLDVLLEGLGIMPPDPEVVQESIVKSASKDADF